jgi:putative isomerase
MNIDLQRVPFSRSGSYLAFSLLPESDDRPGGLYLRSVHGGAVLSQGLLALVEVLVDDRPVPYQVRATPGSLELHTVRGTLSICINEPTLVRVRGEGVGLRLTFVADQGDYAFSTGEGHWQVNCPGARLQFMLAPIGGGWQVNAPWSGLGTRQVTAELLPDVGDGWCEGVLEEFSSAWQPRSYDSSFDECRQAVEEEFVQWLDQTPVLPKEYAQARRLAAYINWSSVVEPVGHFMRPAMYMSKNWMTNVWSWDHCFNAMALSYHKQVMGWDQLMTLFDQQDEYGALPDCVNDRTMVWNFCKPPIHGWTLGWMMQHTNFIRSDQVRQIYGPLARWTEWWFRYRDSDHDGIPEYNHGNDSGWDNATPFTIGVPLEAPDLCAFLILQMETLAKLAESTNNMEEAESWQRRSEELLQKMLAHFWQGDHFVAMRAGDHLVADTESLFLYLPLILGNRLPGGIRRELINGLTRSGRFLTHYGLATESPNSPHYQPDGYWRGPIWAPSTLLLVEGLAACGEVDLAREIARRFCDLCAQNGFAENFDALTGEGLRDRAYTWTSSVFLILGRDYLLDD